MQARILNDLLYRDLRDGKQVELLETLKVQIGIEILRVPKGFTSDLASVPWLFRRSFPRFGPWNAAAIAHDYLYAAGTMNGVDITRKFADRVFLAIMLGNPAVPRWKARAMFIAVRLGTYPVWLGYRRNNKICIRL